MEVFGPQVIHSLLWMTHNSHKISSYNYGRYHESTGSTAQCYSIKSKDLKKADNANLTWEQPSKAFP